MNKAELIDRIEEACYVLRRMPDKERGFLSAGQRGSWPAVIMSFIEAYGLHKVRITLPPPAPAAIDRMHEVLSWLAVIGTADRQALKCVWLICGEHRRIAEVCGIIGLHRNLVRAKRDAGLQMVLDFVDGSKKAA